MMAAGDRFRHAIAAAVCVALIVYCLVADFFGKEIVAEIAIFAILAMSLDLVAGYSGMVSLGHGALFGFGAYMFALFTVNWGAPLPVAMLGASLATGLVGFLAGAVVGRVRGIFFIMATLAIGEMGYEFFFQSNVFGGDDGFSGIPRLDLSRLGIDTADPTVFGLLLIAMTALVYGLVSRLLASPYGRALVGMHENEDRMRALGLPTRLYKATAMAFSGVVAGFAGVLLAMHIQFITPQLLHWTTSGEVLVMIILGGLGTLVGPVIGAAIVILLRNELSSVTDYWGFWLGLFLIAVVLSKSNGVVGAASDLWDRARKRRRASDAGGADAAR